jgi:hypothetical protein
MVRTDSEDDEVCAYVGEGMAILRKRTLAQDLIDR